AAPSCSPRRRRPASSPGCKRSSTPRCPGSAFTPRARSPRWRARPTSTTSPSPSPRCTDPVTYGMTAVPPVPSPPEGSSPLEAENARLREQVKALVRTESRLNVTRQQLDKQMQLFRGLYELGQRNNAELDLRAILEDIVRFTLYELSYERAVVLL